MTFAGTFTKREKDNLKNLSGYMCLDLDHITNLKAKKKKFIADPLLKVQMMFVSPGGDGLKVIIQNPHNTGNYSSDYKQVEKYIFERYGLKIDKTSDVARACFLCYDQGVWIADYLQRDNIEIASNVFLEIQNRFPESRHLNFHTDLQVSGYYDRLLEVLKTSHK